MTRGLDHIVHVVRDLDAAVELYKRLGFQVGARNRHPRSWGTQNHIIQLPGTFIELLAVMDTEGIVSHSSRHFSFGAFNRDFSERGQGLSMLVLEGRGARDVDEFHAQGISHFELYEFEREGKRPDGAPVNLAFALAFASDPGAPDIGFFTCQQSYPENFWNSAFQVHPNSATGVAGVVLVAQDPRRHERFLAAFADAESKSTANGVRIRTHRGGDIEVLTPATFVERFGVLAPDVSRGARLAAVRFFVANPNLLTDLPAVVSAMGAILIFEPSL